jgi:hypothetical protein
MNERADNHLRMMIERLVRSGATEREIERAVRAAVADDRSTRRPRVGRETIDSKVA